MHERARELIETLELNEHPEGGWFREVYRSPSGVTPDGGVPRSAITTIFFLLADGAHRRWHSVASDEIWHWYEGASLELVVTAEGDDLVPRSTVLGPAGEGRTPVAVVRAGEWQAARSLGDYTLVGCSVGPGFDFEDFRLLYEDDALAARFRAELPAWAALI